MPNPEFVPLAGSFRLSTVLALFVCDPNSVSPISWYNQWYLQNTQHFLKIQNGKVNIWSLRSLVLSPGGADTCMNNIMQVLIILKNIKIKVTHSVLFSIVFFFYIWYSVHWNKKKMEIIHFFGSQGYQNHVEVSHSWAKPSPLPPLIPI